jgi:hypothetical protein
MQRPNRGLRPGAPQGKPAGRAPSPAQRTSPSQRTSQRRPAPEKKGFPIQVLFIVIPGILLAGLGLFQLFRSSQPEKVVEKKVVDDPNLKIQDLEKRFEKLRSGLAEFQDLSRKESPSAKAKGEALATQVEAWMAEWDAIFEPKRDADGKLPKELQGYQQVRARVNMLRSDLSRSMGFE